MTSSCLPTSHYSIWATTANVTNLKYRLEQNRMPGDSTSVGILVIPAGGTVQLLHGKQVLYVSSTSLSVSRWQMPLLRDWIAECDVVLRFGKSWAGLNFFAASGCFFSGRPHLGWMERALFLTDRWISSECCLTLKLWHKWLMTSCCYPKNYSVLYCVFYLSWSRLTEFVLQWNISLAHLLSLFPNTLRKG